MMRSTITIDDVFANELMQTTRTQSPIEAIRVALREYIAHEKKRRLLALRGAVHIEDNWQALRAREVARAPESPSSANKAKVKSRKA